MTDSLKDRAHRGVFWSAVDTVAARLVQFVIGVILARLLLPEQFGLIGMLAIFMAVAQALLDSGFSAALIRKKDVRDIDTSSVFYFNLFVGACAAGLLSLAAPWIAAFYKQPMLASLMRAMSLVIVINSFGAVQAALLTRNIDFKTQTKVSVASGTASGVIGVFMASQGYGVWSLVAQQVSAAMIRVVLLWLFNTWRPVWAFSFAALRTMFTFGSRLMVSAIISQVFNNIYYLVIGKLFNPAILGFYTRAKRVEELPSVSLTRVITRVSFPVFASIHEDKTRFKKGLRRAFGAAVFITAPIMIGLIVVAEPLVRTLLTDKWLPCVPYLRLLSILGLYLPLQALNLNALLALGRSDLYLRLMVIRKVFTVINIVVMARWGVTAMICGEITASTVSYCINSYSVSRQIQYRLVQQVCDVAPYFLCAGLMGAAVYVVQYVSFASTLLQLLGQIAAGFAVYPLLCGLLRLQAFSESLEVVSKRWPFGRFGAA